MRTAGIREARQQLTRLLRQVAKGHEIVITDRGRPVARLAPLQASWQFPDLAPIRRAFKGREFGLGEAINEQREDRI